MSKFNRVGVKAPVAQTPIVTVPDRFAVTGNGAPAFVRDNKSQLFLLGISNFVGEKTFYEKAGARDARFTALVQAIAVEDPDWVAGFLPWLRKTAFLRTAPLVAAVDAMKAMLDAGIHGSRSIVASVLERGDEPGEVFAIWLGKYGRNFPMPLKRAVADGVVKLYTERSMAKYDTPSAAFRFGDVVQLSHAKPNDHYQKVLFKYLMDRRFNAQAEIPEELKRAAARKAALSKDASELTSEDVRAAGLTWQNVLSAATDKKAAWEKLIPTMGYMALLRNLRNFDEAGIPQEMVDLVIKKLVDPEEVKRSKQFPYRFLSAYKELNSLTWGGALERAMNQSLANIPELPGRTLILVDRSGSMFGRGLSAESKSDWAEVAGVFGAALAIRNRDRSTLIQYGSTAYEMPTPAGASVLRLVSQMKNLGGTATVQTINATFKGHDRVVVITDEQANMHYGLQVPANVPIYTFNLAGYGAAQFDSSSNRITLGGGLTDGAFRLIPMLEAGSGARWPWEEDEAQEALLASGPVVEAIDKFLDDPSTGAARKRPAR